MQNPKTRKPSRLARSFSLNTEHVEYKIKLQNKIQRRRIKRQFYFGSENIRRDIAEIQIRLKEIDAILNSHINSTSHNTTNTNFTSAISLLSANLSSTNERQIQLEERIDDLEKRIEATELMTAEIAEEMARTQSYLDHLKTNMSKTVEETTSNDTIVTVSEKEEEKLPPSKDLKAFQNYLKDIGEITRKDFQELGNEKEDFIVSCTWQGTICDSRWGIAETLDTVSMCSFFSQLPKKDLLIQIRFLNICFLRHIQTKRRYLLDA